MPKSKYYVVWEGKIPGIYDKWEMCYKQIEGIKDAKYKSFETYQEALEAFNIDYNDFLSFPKKDNINFSKQSLSQNSPEIPSISVDAACAGNPGIMEYRGVYTHNKEVIFHQGPFVNGTNNIGEFLAIVHALAWMDKNNICIPVYTDSITAISWVRRKKSNTKLEMNIENQNLFELIIRAENWLNSHTWNSKI